MTEAPRRSRRTRLGTFGEQILESMRTAPGILTRQEPIGDDDHERPHQDAQSTSTVSGRRTWERGASTRRPRGVPVILMCETCQQQVSAEEAVRCSGCGKGTHDECQAQLDTGDRFHAMLCFMCTNRVTHLLRIV